MRDLSTPKLSKWPFYFADALLFGLAGFVVWQGKLPLGKWEILAMAACVALGALFSIWPFILEYRAAARLAETEALTSVVAQVQNIEIVAKRISEATGQWQTVNECAEKTSAAAKEIADRMTAEAKAFAEFMQQANDSEKSTLRLEVEKLHRAEGDWLQVLVRVFDHVFALHQGAVRSGHPKVVEQLTHFQNACRDAARRVGLVPFVANNAESFDPQRHQTPDQDSQPPAGAVIAETLATGYTFQGKLVRPAIVRVQDGGAAQAGQTEASPAPPAEQNQLPLEPAEPTST